MFLLNKCFVSQLPPLKNLKIMALWQIWTVSIPEDFLEVFAQRELELVAIVPPHLYELLGIL